MPKLKFIYAEPEPVHMGLVNHRACADPGIFVGGLGPADRKKSTDNGFFVVVFSVFHPQLILQRGSNAMVYFKESSIIYNFLRFQGVQHFSGVRSNFFQGGGGHLLIPCSTPYNLWFSRGSGPAVPLWIRACRECFDYKTTTITMSRSTSDHHLYKLFKAGKANTPNETCQDERWLVNKFQRHRVLASVYLTWHRRHFGYVPSTI